MTQPAIRAELTGCPGFQVFQTLFDCNTYHMMRTTRRRLVAHQSAISINFDLSIAMVFTTKQRRYCTPIYNYKSVNDKNTEGRTKIWLMKLWLAIYIQQLVSCSLSSPCFFSDEIKHGSIVHAFKEAVNEVVPKVLPLLPESISKPQSLCDRNQIWTSDTFCNKV